jgi:methionine-gamma-lyase
MNPLDPRQGIGTLVTHHAEGDNPLNAHLTPIYQTAAFYFPDAATGAATFKNEQPGFIYTRFDNPNLTQLVRKIAVLEGLELLRAQPARDPETMVDGHAFASGMAAITAAILAKVKSGDTIIAQEALYGATYSFFNNLAQRYGVNVAWVSDLSIKGWQEAFARHPQAVLAYSESPANPTMALVDLAAVAELAHQHEAWLMVDNTFATPYCQRPLSLGADVVLHSTTKYLSGHGAIIGGVVVSPRLEYVRGELTTMLRTLGGCPSPFDAWLTCQGLKTFEIRLQRQCANARQVAVYLEGHPRVARVYYPGLSSQPDHTLALRQMHDFGGVLSFELKDGLHAGEAVMNRVRLATLAPSLGDVDTLVMHPASMSHVSVPRETRLKMGISDGLVRLSAGIENIEDILSDLEQALAY